MSRKAIFFNINDNKNKIENVLGLDKIPFPVTPLLVQLVEALNRWVKVFDVTTIQPPANTGPIVEGLIILF